MSFRCFFFFFQAEDGIRDVAVTGVQTCALPISACVLREGPMAHPYHHSLSSVRRWGGAVEDYLAIHSWFDASKLITADFRHRSEERRVGKSVDLGGRRKNKKKKNKKQIMQ